VHERVEEGDDVRVPEAVQQLQRRQPRRRVSTRVRMRRALLDGDCGGLCVGPTAGNAGDTCTSFWASLNSFVPSSTTKTRFSTTKPSPFAPAFLHARYTLP